MKLSALPEWWCLGGYRGELLAVVVRGQYFVTTRLLHHRIAAVLVKLQDL